MNKIPLFPLNTVLFPGMFLPLRIFEPRYIAMIKNCITENSSFGIVLLRQGNEVAGPETAPAIPFQTGCLAQLTHVEVVDNDKFNIIIVGTDRFQIDKLYYNEPYLTGDVIYTPLEGPLQPQENSAHQALRPWIKEYLNLLSTASKTEIDLSKLPRSPREFAYTAAALLQIPPLEKQTLLEINNPTGLLEALRPIYQQEISLLKAELLNPPREIDSLFSLN